jgi:hypothetical protein
LTSLEPQSGRYDENFLGEFRELIERFAPKATRFVEWGSGETTKILCAVASDRSDPIVFSIDANDAYQRSVAASAPWYGFLHFRCLALQQPPASQDAPLPLCSDYPLLIGLEFDLAVIDGRRCGEYADVAAQILTEAGVILVHDWRQSEHANWRGSFDVVFEGERFLVLRPKPAAFERHAAFRRNLGTEGNVVIVPAKGARAKAELEITRPFAEAYAKRIGADYVVVGGDSDRPVHRIKCEALDVARGYDRVLLIDADVLIRPQAPDVFAIVPEGALGAFPEGRFFPRQDFCSQVNELYDLGDRLGPQDYFNSGVMVLAQQNLILLEALRDEVVWGQPRFEQGFLNAKRVALDIPLFPLTPEFNYMTEGVFPRDWRYSFFLHHAGSWKDSYLYNELWQDVSGDRKTFARRQFSVADVRAGLIRQAAEQINGRPVRILDPTDFSYETRLAKPIYDPAGLIVAYFPPPPGNAEDRPSIWGPYITLEAGLWRGQFLKQDGEGFAYDGATFDVVKAIGRESILARRPWPSDGVFEFHLAETTENVEFRIYRAAYCAEFASLRLERIGA